MSTIETIIQYGYAYLVPSICVFGILCNIINLTVLLNRRLKESPYTYLTGLATFDILTLLFTLSITFTRSQSLWFNYKIDLQREYILAKLEKTFFLPLANTFSPMSIIVVVALTVERFLFTRFPMKAKDFCVPKYARKVIFLLFICVLIIRIPVYMFYNAKLVRVNSTSYGNSSESENILFSEILFLCNNELGLLCKTKTENYFENFQNIYYFLSFILFQIIPVLVLSILNVSLLTMVEKSHRNSERLQKSDLISSFKRPASTSSDIHRMSIVNSRKSISRVSECSIKSKRRPFESNRLRKVSVISTKSVSSRFDREHVKLRRTLIAVTSCAIISELCSIITYDKIMVFLIEWYDKSYMKNGYQIQRLISNTVVVISHSVNFFLFCAFNTRYLDVFKMTYSLKKKPIAKNWY